MGKIDSLSIEKRSIKAHIDGFRPFAVVPRKIGFSTNHGKQTNGYFSLSWYLFLRIFSRSFLLSESIFHTNFKLSKKYF
jgi:hypothetical protein